MKRVHLIENFQDLCHAFAEVRSGEDPIPQIEDKVNLFCNFGDLEFRPPSKIFAIDEELKPKAKEFLLFLMCTPNYMPSDRLLIDEKFET